MYSAGTLRKLVYPFHRRIPDDYKHPLGRWPFEDSERTRFAWDVNSEEQRALDRGEIPSNAYVDPSLLTLPSSPWAQQSLKQKEARGILSPAPSASRTSLSGLTTGDDFLSFDTIPTSVSHPTVYALISTTTDVPSLPSASDRMSLSMVFDPQEFALHPGEDDWASSLGLSTAADPGHEYINACLPSTAPDTQSVPAFLNAAMTPAGLANTRHLSLPYSPSTTPALSPSGSSTCSSEDFDLMTELSPAPFLHHLRGETSSVQEEKNDYPPTIDPRLLLQPLPVETRYAPEPCPAQENTHASTFEHKSKDPFTAASIAPTLTQTTDLSTLCTPAFLPETPAPRSKSKPKSGGGPSRTRNSRATREVKPYQLRESSATGKRSSRDKQPRAEDSRLNGGKMYKCPECGYAQTPGAGATRSFKRHLEIHYKTVEWRCRGIPRPDGTYVGGCDKVFSRKDALIRHIKHTETGCVSDFEPCELPVEFDLEAMFGDA